MGLLSPSVHHRKYFFHVSHRFFMSPASNRWCNSLYVMPQVFVEPALFAYVLCPHNGPETGIIAGEGEIHFIIKRSFGLPFPKKLAVVVYACSYVPARLVNVNKGGVLIFDLVEFYRQYPHYPQLRESSLDRSQPESRDYDLCYHR